MRFAIGNPGSFLKALQQGGLVGTAINNGWGGGVLGKAGFYDPMKGLVGTAFDKGLGGGVIGGLFGKGGGRGGRRELDNNDWLNQTYENLLGRDLGEEGAAYWGGELDGGMSRDSVRDSIMESDEYWLNRTYNELLGRNVGDEGRNYWGDELAGGVAKDSVRDSIMQSDEYRDYQDYGRRGGRGGRGCF